MSLRVALAVSLLIAITGCTLKEEGPPPVPAPPDVAAPPADAVRTPSGLASKVIRPGRSNTRPTAASTVVVHYTGWTTDGRMFDSSLVREDPARPGTFRPDPAEFSLGGVIPGWTEGVQLMVVGEQRRFWIPGNLAYDSDTRPGVPKGMLVFDIELLDVK
jgi:peptidylprolyl isomerase